MKLTISKEELSNYVNSQISTFFPDNKNHPDELQRYMDEILYRTEYCFSKVNAKNFFDGNDVLFNHLNADQYAMFLYFASNTLYKNNSDTNLCTKIFLLNRYLYSIDVYYEVALPDIFLFVHAIGTVLGRASYSDYCIFYQQCNVGGSPDAHDKLIYPTLSEHLTMHPNSCILGNCIVDKNCTMAAGSMLLNTNLNAQTLYIGNPRDNVMKSRVREHYAWK